MIATDALRVTRRVLPRIGVGMALCFPTLAISSTEAVAYEGAFCTHWYLDPGGSCSSSTVTHIRRAIGNSNESFTEVQISANTGYKAGHCVSAGCTADTGYLGSDGTGHGTVKNYTANRSDYFYGYLYP